jgi:hypothetical protein
MFGFGKDHDCAKNAVDAPVISGIVMETNVALRQVDKKCKKCHALLASGADDRQMVVIIEYDAYQELMKKVGLR